MAILPHEFLKTPVLIPANDPDVDYPALVRRGYDTCAQAYDRSRRLEPGIELQALSNRLENGDSVLDAGCGAGVPIARSLAERYRVTGVDLSREMVRRARRNVPGGHFICADIMSVDLPTASFDAVVAFYTVFHLPRERHSALFHRAHRWLRPHGHLLCTLSDYPEEGYTEDDFFGVTMYWSNYGIDEYRELLTGNGFSLLEVSTTGHGYQEGMQQPTERHPLVLAQKE